MVGVRGYQLALSPALHTLAGPWCGCRFSPSCSHYALEALATHGALRGSALAARRLLKCHPWGPSGLDPVPPRARA
jgi:putative membrane protein insertion efficiency factor